MSSNAHSNVNAQVGGIVELRDCKCEDSMGGRGLLVEDSSSATASSCSFSRNHQANVHASGKV